MSQEFTSNLQEYGKFKSIYTILWIKYEQLNNWESQGWLTVSYAQRSHTFISEYQRMERPHEYFLKAIWGIHEEAQTSSEWRTCKSSL